MHLAGTTYEEAYRTFRWEVPARFNIAQAICDEHAARAPEATALLYEQADGQLRAWSFAEIQSAANRLANVLGAFGAGPGTIVGIHLPQCPESLIATSPSRSAVPLRCLCSTCSGLTPSPIAWATAARAC